MDEQQAILEELRAIRANQEQQMKAQEEALEMQRRQFERAEKLQERAEKLQDAGASTVTLARRALVVILPVVLFLVAYLSWLMFR